MRRKSYARPPQKNQPTPSLRGYQQAMRKVAAPWVMGLLLAVGGCHGSSQSEAPEPRFGDVSGSFHAIAFSGAFDVDVVAGAKPKVKLKGSSRDLENVQLTVDDGVLAIHQGTRFPFWNREALELTIVAPELDHILCHGATHLNVNDLQGEHFALDLHGPTDVTLDGAVESLKIVLSGTGHVDSTALAAKVVDVALSGSGRIDVQAQTRLDVEIAGTGQIGYKGSPEIHKSIAGTGVIHPL